MQYFYLLNNKDIYGVDGRFFGPNLSVCDCVDYFKHLGVQEGTSMDINVGGFNGCYEYKSNTLSYKTSSCGNLVACNQAITFNLLTCACQISSPYRRHVYARVYTTNAFCYALGMQYQVGIGSLPSPNWNVTEWRQTCPNHSPGNFTTYFITSIDGTQMPNVYVRFRWQCYDGATYYNGIWQPSQFIASQPMTTPGALCSSYGLPAC